jgi:hypothetical protein
MGDDYYPRGGWLDFIGDFDTVKEALTIKKTKDWWHIVDSHIKAIIEMCD